MDILMFKTWWAHKKWNKIASDIKLVFHSSTIVMMHGPINIIFTMLSSVIYRGYLKLSVLWLQMHFQSWNCSQAVSKPVWHISLLCVQWKTPDDGQMNCPKHVEFYSKNKFEKLVHVVGFITRIYHNARSTERQIIPEYVQSFLNFEINISHLTQIATFEKPTSTTCLTCVLYKTTSVRYLNHYICKVNISQLHNFKV
jgi:hypothetical protein